MNVTSKHIRNKLKVFDHSFWNKISKNALLRDAGYWVPKLSDLQAMVIAARSNMALTLGLELDQLSSNHTGSNGRWDCDNYAIFGCACVKAMHDKVCRNNKYFDRWEYAIWPVSRSDINHTQALCLTEEGWYIVEFITGQIQPLAEIPKFKALLVG